MEMSLQSWQEIKAALREVLAEEMGTGRYEIARRWEGGKLILQPHDTALQSKEIPLETFFKKITAVREKLRVLEQKINNHAVLSNVDKAEFQGVLTRAYGSLTTFNLLFRDEEDRFSGQKS
ncbi:MAG TPA: hypothetical protein ENN29_02485 [Candidatus Hydrogenedentes bacterium]|nr:hypothetical protein [Candidatus Hydrogenedentota bacterium]